MLTSISRATRWRSLTAALVGSVLLVACGTSSRDAKLTGFDAAMAEVHGQVEHPTDPWAANCYAGFERDVLALSGEQARDCGFLRIDALGGDRGKVDRCLRNAMADNQSFRVGHIDGDGKTLACDVAMRDDNGQLWRLWYDFDVGNVQSQGMSDGVLVASRCTNLKFKAGSTLPGSFFALEGCEPVPAGVASVPFAPGFRR